MCALGHEFIHPKSLLRIENLVVQLEATVQLTTNISELVEQRQPVLVEWSGVDSPGEQVRAVGVGGQCALMHQPYDEQSRADSVSVPELAV